MDDPNSLDPNMSLTGKKGSKVPMIVIGVIAAGGIGFAVFKMMKQQDQRKLHAKVMEDFANVERDDLGKKFWSCVLGPNVDAGMFKSNLELSARITSQFGTDAKNYPGRIREECTPKAIDAKHKVESIAATAPSEYADPMKKYGDALKAIADALDEWTKAAPAQIQDMEISRKLDPAGAAWHGFAGGTPDKDVIAFDRFIHCAVPDVDKMKDGQALVEYLFNQCKNPTYLEKLNGECGKELIADPPGLPSKGMAATIKKLGSDDRDMSAFDDCMRKGRKGKRRDDLADVGKAWVAWMEAGTEVRKIGKEALKE